MDFTELLNSFAFPIVACIFLAWYLNEQQKINRQDTKEANKLHSEETKALKTEIKESIDKNTIALKTLINIFKYNFNLKEGEQKDESK